MFRGEIGKREGGQKAGFEGRKGLRRGVRRAKSDMFGLQNHLERQVSFDPQ